MKYCAIILLMMLIGCLPEKSYRQEPPKISHDTANDGFWFYFRHQLPWMGNGGGEFAGNILEHIPDDSVKKWIGKYAFDSLLKDYNKP